MSCTINTTTTDDQIRCEFLLRAPKEKVWNALTTREGWSGWFSEDIETDFQLGSAMKMDFGKYGECWGIVSERDEHKAFAYQWHPGDGCVIEGGKYPKDELTTVRFELEETTEGTKVVMTEFGFKQIPEERRGKAFADNTGGWVSELEEMVAWLEEDKHQPVTAGS